jgi:hypothetical protein
MTMQTDHAKLDPQSDTLYSLPNDHRTGLITVGTAALISFLPTTSLFLFISYKLLIDIVQAWSHHDRPNLALSRRAPTTSNIRYPERGSISHRLGGELKPVSLPTGNSNSMPQNPFPLLVYNLLLAEMQTSLGYTLNIEWVVRNGISVGTTTC